MAAWLAVVACAAAFAHDSFEITADAQLRADVLELRVTMAPSTAMRFLTAGAEKSAFKPADFERLRPRFTAQAGALFALAHRGAALVLRRVEVNLGREADVEFLLAYALPAVDALRFDALHLKPMPSGYGTVLTVHGRAGEMLGQKLLGGEDPVLEVKVPATPATPATVAQGR